MTTQSEENQLVSAIEQAVKSDIKPMPTPRPCACNSCGKAIEIGATVVALPGKRAKTFTICGDCFELYSICPGPRPME